MEAMKCTALCPCWKARYDEDNQTATILCATLHDVTTVGTQPLGDEGLPTLDCITQDEEIQKCIDYERNLLNIMECKLKARAAQRKAQETAQEAEAVEGVA